MNCLLVMHNWCWLIKVLQVKYLNVNRAVQAALQGRKRALLTLCTGAGKTAVAFQTGSLLNRHES